ncbi:hypothetical protein [Chryseobacterium populi]|nr:hypothetical protein [Chryseobacterium populi]
MKILVYADASISYVKDFDSLNIEKKKCAFDFGRKLIPYLKRWVPAKEDDKFVGAIANVEINPFLLYYSKDDPKDNIFTYPEFKKGLPAFSYEVRRIFEQKIRKNEDRYGSFSFTINEKGIMEDIKVEGEYTDQEKKQLASDLSKIKGEWNPASYNGIPRKYTLRQSVTQQFDIKTEHNKLNNPLNQNGFYRSH